MDGDEGPGPAVRQLPGQPLRQGDGDPPAHPGLQAGSGKLDPGVLGDAFGLRLGRLLLQLRTQEVAAFVHAGGVEGADAVAHAGDVLVAQRGRLHRQPVQGPGHHDEGAVAAFRRLLAEFLGKVEELPEGGAGAHVHDARVVLRPLRREAVGPVGLELVAQVPAGDPHRPPPQHVHRQAHELPQGVMLRQGQGAEADAQELVVLPELAGKPEGHHDPVVQGLVLFPQGPGGEALLGRQLFHGLRQLRVVFLPEAHFRRPEGGKGALGLPAGGDMEPVGIHDGVGAGNDDGVRLQGGDLPRHAGIGFSGLFDLPFAAPPHLGHDQGRMGHHEGCKNGHGLSLLRP